jgi:hypothetical protein
MVKANRKEEGKKEEGRSTDYADYTDFGGIGAITDRSGRNLRSQPPFMVQSADKQQGKGKKRQIFRK